MKKILLVDDDATFLELAVKLLREAGYEVEACKDSLKAMEMLGRSKFHGAVIDYKMPELDGQDLLRLIHTKYPDIPIVICSGALDIRETDLRHDGAFQVIHKPFDPLSFVTAVQNAMAGEEDVETTLVPVKGYDLRKTRDLVMRKVIIKALTKTDFNVTHAAKLLGISRQYLLRYLKHYQINGAVIHSSRGHGF